MIKHKCFNITLAYCEITALEDHLHKSGNWIGRLTDGASFSASKHGIVIRCISEQQADRLWDAVLEATDNEEEY